VLHLDLKSQNVFVLRDGRVKVLDFGLAGLDWDEEVPGRLTRVAGGTPATMAPEQAEVATTDARTDIWAVGVILHQMLFGRLPETLAPDAERVSLPDGTSARAQKILARTLCRDPESRYPGAAALVAALAEARTPQADYFWRDPLANAQYQRLTDFEGTEQSAAISRDGKFVAFISSRDGRVGVLVTNLGTGTFRNVTGGRVREGLVNREVRTIEFSPDGARLFFWVGASDTLNHRAISTWVVPTLGGEPRVAL